MSYAGAAPAPPSSSSAGRRSRYVARAALELAIIATLYLAYRFGRLIGIGREDVANGHAQLVHRTQQVLHLPSEARIQDVVSVVPDIYELANSYYVALHFPVIVAFLLWGFFARPRQQYAWARNLLIVQTSLALLIHVAFPLAPPRMFPEWGFVDTMAVFGPDAYGGASGSVANQYAAMPSLHIGWALWCGIAIYCCARHKWVRALGLAYPVGTLIVIVGTANHFILDAVGGALIIALAFGVQWVLSGHGAFTAPVDAPDFEPVVAAADQP
jgi:hypothetical protein